MFISFLVQLASIAGLIATACVAFVALADSNFSDAKIHGGIFVAVFVFLAIYRAHRRNVRVRKPVKQPKWLNKVCARAQSALTDKDFYCVQCHRLNKIARAELIVIDHNEEEIYSEECDEPKIKKSHDFGGFVCKKCARVIRGCSNDETSYVKIPKELRS